MSDAMLHIWPKANHALKYSCECGFSTLIPEEFEAHGSGLAHTQYIAGRDAERERCALIADKESRECGDCYYCQVNHAKTVARLIRQEHDRGPQATAEDAVMDDGDGN